MEVSKLADSISNLVKKTEENLSGLRKPPAW
jgi:hypothetical protein